MLIFSQVPFYFMTLNASQMLSNRNLDLQKDADNNTDQFIFEIRKRQLTFSGHIMIVKKEGLKSDILTGKQEDKSGR